MTDHLLPWLVHGVVAAADIHLIREVKDVFGLGTIAMDVEDGLAMVASAVPATVDLAEAFADENRVAKIALAHHQILAEICGVGDVVPVRLGSAISGATKARDLIREHGLRYRTSLRLIAGLVEFAVVISDGESQAAPVVRPADGRGYLKARAAMVSEVQARPQRVAATIAAVSAMLGEAAVSQAERPLPRLQPVAPRRHFDATCLVERTLVAAFLNRCRTAPRLLSEHGLALTVRGPWPAYSLAGESGSLS
jgi:hypothetical protein